MWKNSGKFSGHTVDFVTRFSLASVCGYLRTSFWSRVFHEMVVFFLTKSLLASYQELLCKLTLLASSRPER